MFKTSVVRNEGIGIKRRMDEGSKGRWGDALKGDKRISRTDGDEKLVIR